jgi:hypothetical protein
MKEDALEERARAMLPRYEKLFDGRGGITPSDPLQFHLFHLARYWSRLVGFCRQDPVKPEVFISSDLGACVKVGSDFAHKLVDQSSPIYGLWQNYWIRTQAALHERPVTIESVEAASRAFDQCLAELKFDPWS